MNEELTPMDEIRAYVESKKDEPAKEETTAVAEVKEGKSITELSANDIKIKLDESKSMEAQAEDVVGAIATAKAVQDENVAKELSDKKAEELIAKAEAKKKAAQTAETKAEVEKQEANRRKNEAVLQTFGINKHLPDWLLNVMVLLFSPIYIVLTIIIGIPCGVVKVLIDDIDNILVTYENAEAQGKRKIKATVWLLLILALIGLGLVITLKIFRKI